MTQAITPKTETTEVVLERQPLERVDDLLVVDEAWQDEAEDDEQDADHDADPDDRVAPARWLGFGDRRGCGGRGGAAPSAGGARPAHVAGACVRPAARPGCRSRPVLSCPATRPPVGAARRDGTRCGRPGAARGRRRAEGLLESTAHDDTATARPAPRTAIRRSRRPTNSRRPGRPARRRPTPGRRVRGSRRRACRRRAGGPAAGATVEPRDVRAGRRTGSGRDHPRAGGGIGSRSSSRCGTAGWPPRRSRSIAAPRRSWRSTCRRHRGATSSSRPAATAICPTSDCSLRLSGRSSSTRTTSTRPCPGPGSGTSSGSR